MLIIGKFLARMFLWFALSFVAAVVILALLNDVPERFSKWQQSAASQRVAAASFERAREDFESEANDLVETAEREIRHLESAAPNELKEARRDIERRQKSAQKRILDERAIGLAAAFGESESIVASYRAEYIELPLLNRSARLIDVRLSNFRKREAFSQERDALITSIRRHNQKVKQFNRRLNARNALQRAARAQWRNPLCSRTELPQVCDKMRRLRVADKRLKGLKSDLDQEKQQIRLQKRMLRAADLQKEVVEDAKQFAENAVAKLDTKARTASDRAKGQVWNQSVNALQQYGWRALLIVLGASLMPVGLKALIFWGVAPLADRAPPLRLRNPGETLQAGASGVTVDVPLGKDTELLVRSGVQDRSSNMLIDDKLFLKNSMFLTCAAAGLVNLQRFRSNEKSFVTVSSTEEGHFEVALIELPAGGALVLHARALVGVVKARKQNLVVRRPLRIGWLISWITFQFRYIVFEGPCTLIVQGSMGVRVKDAELGRATNKRVVLGFDASLAYGAMRSGSFLPYLLGRASLYDDCFEGKGRYIYEAKSVSSGPGTIWGRGLKGIGDAFQRAIGI